MKTIRALVVEDSVTVRKHIVDVLGAESDIDVVGEAEDGSEAIELCRELRPDVVTLDMMLPVMSGLAATEYIMAHFPTPILVVSSSMNRGELFKTYEALAAGAVDVLEKPGHDEADHDWERRLVSSVRLVSRIKVITHPRAKLAAARAPIARSSQPRLARRSRDISLVAIGASTGGPGAIVAILRALPPDFTLPILVVQHISEPFSASFADWLDSQSSRRVSCARDGESLKSLHGRAVIAPSGSHLVVRNGHLFLSTEPERHSCRPSVDVLFESIARECGATSAGCLLTGMGTDGAAGLLSIRRAGGLTMAQDRESSIVYGMPGEAVRLDAVERELPLSAIGPEIARLTNGAV